MFQDFPKYSEFEQESYLQGSKTTIEEILNKEIVIVAFQNEPSKVNKNSTYNKIQIIDEYIEDKPQYKIFFSGSKVLDKQLKKYKQQLPFRATIIKQNNYYTLT